MNETSGAYVVAWDFSKGKDTGILLVGDQKDGHMKVVNAFQDKEAYDIYEKLSKVKGKDAD